MSLLEHVELLIHHAVPRPHAWDTAHEEGKRQSALARKDLEREFSFDRQHPIEPKLVSFWQYVHHAAASQLNG